MTADPGVEGRYHCDLSDAWNVVYAFGGVTMAAAVGAARAHVGDPRFSLRNATAMFLAPIPAGPLLVEVKTAKGHLPWDPDFEPGEAKWGGWFRFRKPPTDTSRGWCTSGTANAGWWRQAFIVPSCARST